MSRLPGAMAGFTRCVFAALTALRERYGCRARTDVRWASLPAVRGLQSAHKRPDRLCSRHRVQLPSWGKDVSGALTRAGIGPW